ncbi:hypothetical protein ATANTOWER_029542 [Ataeniobius toweri]|uniref:Uncharacterized protein n=1 Tax=Ataeniobius toweri TaxID=208326 RepID=A0ABU7CM47_9TELE|nr:hypothetical protein [Ataeniobius toweri]
MICFIAGSKTTKLCQGNGRFTHLQLDQFIAMPANSCHHKSMHSSADSVIGNIQRGLVITKRVQNIDKTCCLYCTVLNKHAEWTLLLPDSVRQNSSTGKNSSDMWLLLLNFWEQEDCHFEATTN